MIATRIQEKGILAKLLEKAVRILLIKECKKIKIVKIDIISKSIQIIKGEIEKINIIAEDVNYKNLLFNLVELETNNLKINYNLKNQELYFTDNPIINFKISICQKSLKAILLSKYWSWIGDIISKEILNQEKLEDLKIRNGVLLMEASEKNISINKVEEINIKADEGKVYLINKIANKTIQIPIEDKIYIKNINIENNLINIFANSSINF